MRLDATASAVAKSAMLTDRYDNALSTASAEARDAYVAGVDLLLSANAGAEDAFRRALAADEGFALAQAGLARTLQLHAKVDEAKEAIARAQQLAAQTSPREQAHVAALALLIERGGPAALAAAREHLATYPRDAMVLAPCTGVFGLIGFSGRSGREQELLALLDGLAGAYGDDWWFGSVHAFAQVETGDVARAQATIERSLAQNPRNAHGAHIRAHVYYECGERAAGLGYLRDWWRDYDKEGLLHCHVSWHVALWELELGRPEAAWKVYRDHLHPEASWGPPINTLSDTAAFLFRAELAGEPRQPDLWRDVSRYAARMFPSPGLNFADVHAALAHAFAGDAEALARSIEQAKGPAADMVAPLAQAFGALSRESWAEAVEILMPIMAAHERIGGSRAQRDLIEYALVVCLLRLGRTEEARRLLRTRRPRSGARDVPIRGM
jgi:thioredoxin-like negative regulator of GroEL